MSRLLQFDKGIDVPLGGDFTMAVGWDCRDETGGECTTIGGFGACESECEVDRDRLIDSEETSGSINELIVDESKECRSKRNLWVKAMALERYSLHWRIAPLSKSDPSCQSNISLGERG